MDYRSLKATWTFCSSILLECPEMGQRSVKRDTYLHTSWSLSSYLRTCVSTCLGFGSCPMFWTTKGPSGPGTSYFRAPRLVLGGKAAWRDEKSGTRPKFYPYQGLMVMRQSDHERPQNRGPKYRSAWPHKKSTEVLKFQDHTNILL